MEDITENMTDSQVIRYIANALDTSLDTYTKLESDTLFQAKEVGKGLSTNDFTNEYKNKLDTIPEKYFVMTGGVTLTNSTTETSMLDGGIGSKTILANTLKAGDVLEFYWFHRLTCGTSQESYVRVKLGGVVLKEHLATLPNNLNANMFEGTIKITVLSEGVAGTCRISGSSEVLQNNLTGLKRDLGNVDIKPLNTTIDNEFDLTYQWLTASTGNINTSYTSILEKN